MKRLFALFLALVLISGFFACGKKEEPAVQPQSPEIREEKEPEKAPEEVKEKLKISIDDWPRIDGALACVPFYENAAAELLDMPVEEARQYVLSNNTPSAFDELAQGQVDLIFCGHANEEQSSYAASMGVNYEYIPFNRDAFVFFVNKNNPVDNITKAQLHDIYAGKITNWKELGGNDEEIIAYQRNEGSGSQTGLYRYLIDMDDVMTPPVNHRIGEMGGIIDAVAYYDNSSAAIGYSYLYFVTNQHFDEDIKLLSVDGVAPTNENIISEAYPMLAEYCLVMNSEEPADSVVRKIAEWCISDEGQALAHKFSYVGIK